MADKRYSDIPGDTRMVMGKATKDATGKVWPKGTIYQPLSSGHDWSRNRMVSVIGIRGERVEIAS